MTFPEWVLAYFLVGLVFSCAYYQLMVYVDNERRIYFVWPVWLVLMTFWPLWIVAYLALGVRHIIEMRRNK